MALLHYESRRAHDPSAPLALLVHGRAGDRKVMWAFRRCIPDSFHIVSPEANLPDRIGGYSWWEVEGEPKESVREHAEEAAERIERFLPEVSKELSVTPRFVVALGFSQGAALLSLLIQRKPELFRGAALLAGFVFRAERISNDPSALPEVFMAHGTEDQVVPFSMAEKGRDHLTGAGFKVALVTDPVGHKVGTMGMRALKEWVGRLAEIEPVR